MRTACLILTLSAVLSLAISCQSVDREGSETREHPPNIVFILADDQGWNALSVPADPDVPESGSSYFQTPSLAKLNLKQDGGESRNLAEEKPLLAKRMYEDMTAYFARFGWDESQIRSTQEMK